MTIPRWVLLGFAGWTLMVLSGTVGVYRLSNIVFRGSGFGGWRTDDTQGSGWYRRAMRAHMNCVENLPVYAAIVLCGTAAGATGPLMDGLSLIVLGARVCQTTTHIAFEQTDRVAATHFAFFLVQLLCMFVIGASVAISAAEYPAGSGARDRMTDDAFCFEKVLKIVAKAREHHGTRHQAAESSGDIRMPLGGGRYDG